MFIVVNGFILIENDTLGIGGRCVKVSCDPIETYENAKRDSFCTEYDEEGNQTFPQIPENMMRVKGQPYWLNMTLAGSYKNEKNAIYFNREESEGRNIEIFS